MENLLEITMLYDFYGELLTQKQRAVLELYYLNDLSLNEISKEYNITRQAVRDMIKRTEHILLQYEEKLMLVEKFRIQKETVHHAFHILNEIIEQNNLQEIQRFEEVQHMLEEILY